jgi:hypothetical protein
MADNSSTGLWLSEGVMAEPEELPVSSHLHARIETWCGWYEQSQDYPTADQRTIAIDWTAFSLKGLSIAREIKVELPGWTVVYFDESAYLQASVGGNHSREFYEYEVRWRNTCLGCSSNSA